MKTIAVDFDGVIHKYSKGWQDGSTYDEPVLHALPMLHQLSKSYNIVIFTTRQEISNIREWWGKWWSIEMPSTEMWCPEITNIKPLAVVYIDDRALRFTSWLKTLQDLVHTAETDYKGNTSNCQCNICGNIHFDPIGLGPCRST